MPNLHQAISKLRSCKHLLESELKSLYELVRSILVEEPNIQPVVSTPPATHHPLGTSINQRDFAKLFSLNGQPGGQT
ncbi:hypothetical protein PtA15_2A361 [Puccinia triticina]|uniref:Uncharacterized protein n=1 Tax=Puccinia triticina TaxID=208348 RepID=A0ABY7CCE2_9BASI|nr:uncharacterized protein PtA15_2A361 [Puccinia triticina]WAQ82048.1 hypothetical protein PtA15_2A361 [Puccinia triticina]WAR52917.1 hypothetical protein PtB15_2B345 [Puccinia triticina]